MREYVLFCTKYVVLNDVFSKLVSVRFTTYLYGSRFLFFKEDLYLCRGNSIPVKINLSCNIRCPRFLRNRNVQDNLMQILKQCTLIKDIFFSNRIYQDTRRYSYRKIILRNTRSPGEIQAEVITSRSTFVIFVKPKKSSITKCIYGKWTSSKNTSNVIICVYPVYVPVLNMYKI